MARIWNLPERDRRPVGELKRLVPFLRPYWKVAIAAFVSLVVAAGAVLTIGQAIRRVVDNGFAKEAGFIDQYFIALLGVVVVLAVATFGRFYLVTWLGERVVSDLRRAVYDHVITLSPAFYEATRVGELLSRLTADATLVQSVVDSTASVAMRNLLLFLGGSVLLVISSPKLTGIVFLMLPVVVVPLRFIGRKVRTYSRQAQDRVADISAHAEETLNAVEVIQAFNHEGHDRARFSRVTENAFDAAVRHIRARAWLTALVMLLVFGAVDLVVWIGATDVIDGRMSGGELAAFVFYAIVVAGAASALMEVYGQLQRAAGAAERLAQLMGERPEIEAPASPLVLPAPAAGALRLEAVSFHYRTRPDAPALHDVTLDIAAGETVALVGPSGAGKSTLFALLLRFYDPTSGAVHLDGVDIAEADPHAVRDRFALVPQEPVIFAASALDNIRYGRPEASEAKVRAAAEAAHALDFLEALPEGLASHLGERGTRLSGGQRQRIAIARAILRDPAVLLLDEATSALDAESERMVQLALERLMAKRTTLVIAHRLATVQKADRIVVLDQGRVVDDGRHGELVARGGLYARLAALQFEQALRA